jgi:hypothetical protein
LSVDKILCWSFLPIKITAHPYLFYLHETIRAVWHGGMQIQEKLESWNFNWNVSIELRLVQFELPFKLNTLTNYNMQGNACNEIEQVGKVLLYVRMTLHIFWKNCSIMMMHYYVCRAVKKNICIIKNNLKSIRSISLVWLRITDE